MSKIKEAVEALQRAIKEELDVEPTIKIFVHNDKNELSADEAKGAYEKLRGEFDLRTLLDNVLLENGSRCYSSSSIGNVEAVVFYKQAQ